MNKNSDRPIIPPIIHEGESDSNLSPNRQNWQANQTDPQIQRLLAEDEKYYLRQSVSTPCLSAIKKAEGLWIEDMSGKRFMDFHGNSVHHIGYGHPRLIAAIAPAHGLAHLATEGRLAATMRSGEVDAQAQDALVDEVLRALWP